MKCIKLVLLLLLASHSTIAQPLTLTASIIRSLDSIATQDVAPGSPGIATCIIQDGKVIYQKMAGYANLEDSTPITTETRFNLASNGKQFTALAILQLAREKKLSLQDDIRRYLPGLYRKLPFIITIENLLTHTSGLRDVYDLWALQGITWWKNTFSNADVLKLLEQQQELNFPPGERYLYSNSNYILLAEIGERVTGKPFYQYCKTLFQKLGMRQTSFEADYRQIEGPVARPYFNFSTWSNYDWIWNAYGDGNLFSTLADQVRWEQALQTGRSKHLPLSLLARTQEQPAGKMSNYGYGLEFGEYRGLPCTFHEGATGAWKATVLRFPQYKLSFLTFTNSGKAIPSMQTRQMADVLQGTPGGFATAPTKYGDSLTTDEVVGIYQTPGGFTFQLEKRDSSLFLIRSGRNDVRLVREGANVFHQWNDRAFKQEFLRNKEGAMELTAYYTTHAPYTLTRAEVDWNGFSFVSLEGAYHNSETGVYMEMRYLGNQTYEVMLGKQKRKAILVTRSKLVMDNYSLEVKTSGTVGAEVPELFLNGDRIQQVRFGPVKK
jgi:CubicO group peptidase (beta-lactamase class C family)